MKLLKLCACVLALGCCFSAFAGEKVGIDVKVLPEAAQQFLEKSFKGVPVSSIEVDKTIGIITFGLVRDYEVILADSTKIEFDKTGEWESVKNKINGVSKNVIPERINVYVAEKFPEAKIIKIAKKSYGLKIELNSDLELMFKVDGTFIGLDD